jgi:hypothetical protein
MTRLMRWLCKHEMKLIATGALLSVPPIIVAENPLLLPQAPAIVILWVTATLLSALRAILADDEPE